MSLIEFTVGGFDGRRQRTHSSFDMCSLLLIVDINIFPFTNMIRCSEPIYSTNKANLSLFLESRPLVNTTQKHILLETTEQGEIIHTMYIHRLIMYYF